MSVSVPVFVGSTFVDLQAHRAAVREALHGLEAAVRGMEYFGSLPDTPKEECLRSVRGCRIYIGLFAMRYGSIDSVSGKSLTHLEYDEAQRISLPSLIYLIDEDRQPVLPKHVDTEEGAVKLRAFKELLRSRHVITLFTSPDDLAAKVTRDVPQLASRSGFEVRAGELAKLVSAIPRIDWLTDERFEFLKRELGEAAAPIPSDAVLREALEFILSRDNHAAAFLLTRTTRLNLRASIDLLMGIEKRLHQIIRRGTEALAAK
ncbi:MAG: DUF4062 domain-containing protein [Gemmatimonadaceae bacterium]